MKYLQYQHKDKFLTGFTLIEALVAVTILTVALAGLINAVWLSIRILGSAERKYIATKIAQEGMELFISKRNNNVICLNNGCTYISNWQENLTPSNPSHRFALFAENPAQLLAWNSISTVSAPSSNYDVPVCHNTDLDRFVRCSTNPGSVPIAGNPKRRIDVTSLDLEPLNPGNEGLRVQTTVTWTERGNTRTITLEKVLFNTQP